MKRTLLAAACTVALAFGILTTTACSSGLNTTLDLINTAVDLFLPFVPNVPAPAAALIESYLTAATTAVENTAAELASTDTGAVKAEKIAVYFEAAVVPNLTALGLSPQVTAKLQGIVNAVDTFLKDITGGKLAATASGKASLTTPLISAKQASAVTKHAADTRLKIAAAFAKK